MCDDESLKVAIDEQRKFHATGATHQDFALGVGATGFLAAYLVAMVAISPLSVALTIGSVAAAVSMSCWAAFAVMNLVVWLWNNENKFVTNLAGYRWAEGLCVWPAMVGTFIVVLMLVVELGTLVALGFGLSVLWVVGLLIYFRQRVSTRTTRSDSSPRT